MTSSILVTGGTGTLGRLVVRHLHTAGCEVRVLSRHSHESEPGIHYIAGDLLTGDGIDEAVEGVDAIVHSAGNFKSDAAMTRNLVQAARNAGDPHIVFISVVGSDRIPVVGFGRGPRVYRMSELVRGYLRAAHRRRLLLPIWLPGKSARAIRAGGNLVAPAVPAVAVGTRTWEDFLVARTASVVPK